MSDLQTHYALLLGHTSDWAVESIDLSLREKRVEIRLVHQGGALECPECGASCRCADHAPERTWRHLDTMQFETVLRVRVPRCRCEQCGVKTVAVPWASKSSRFTWLFEAVAIEVLKAASSVKRAAELLRLDWRWYGWASRSRLRPVIKKTKMLKRHLDNLLTYAKHKVTIAMVEGFNSKIQSLKANARGFRSFASYRIRILFFCGRLNMQPLQASR